MITMEVVFSLQILTFSAHVGFLHAYISRFSEALGVCAKVVEIGLSISLGTIK